MENATVVLVFTSFGHISTIIISLIVHFLHGMNFDGAKTYKTFKYGGIHELLHPHHFMQNNLCQQAT